MPFRLDEFRAKIQFTTSAQMPSLIYKASLVVGVPSNTVYCQYALCDALARDLGISIAELRSKLPVPRGPAGALMDPAVNPMSRYGKPAVPLSQQGFLQDVR